MWWFSLESRTIKFNKSFINQLGITMPMVDEWEQQIVMHCPDHKCNGMLLQSDFRHEMKCSKCNKMWFLKTEFIEVKDMKKKKLRQTTLDEFFEVF